jgi:hypothetical protein
MPDSRAVMAGMSGSGPLGAEAHIAWFGQPAQESAFPAVSDSGPGQCSGSGATSLGALLRGLESTSCTSSGASREGAMVCMEVTAEWLLDGEGNWAEMMFTKQKRGVPISGGVVVAESGRR